MSINNYPNTDQCENGPKHSNDTAQNESHMMGEEEVNSKPSENMNLNDIKQPSSTNPINIDEINPINENEDYDINSNLFFLIYIFL